MDRTRRSWRRLAALALAASLVAVPAWAETLAERVERMERELAEMKAELKRRDEADARRRAEEDAARAKASAAPAATAAASAAPPAPGTPGTAVATAKEGVLPETVREITDRVKVGGYGSLRYEGTSLPDQNNTFTYRRFVLTTDARIAPRLSSYFELEFERFRKLEIEKSAVREDGGLSVEQAVEGTNDSEIALEQAWLQFDFDDWAKLRGGAVLVPLGRFNLEHDDNRWDLPRRSLVDRGVPVLPAAAAWDELGVGLLGDVPLSDDVVLSYQAYGVNGVALDTEFEQVAQTRFPEPAKNVIEVEIAPETGTFSQDVKDAKAFTGRLALSPRLGHEVAGSWYWGQYTPDFLDESQNVWSLAGDWKSVWGPFELEGEYVYTRWEGIEKVARSLARAAVNSESEFENDDLETEVEFELANLARSKQGYWLDLRYRFWPHFLSDTVLGRPFENPSMALVLRGEQVWLNGLVEEVAFAGGRLNTFETDDRRVDRITLGLAYRPVPLVVFQLAYEFTQTNKGKSLSGVTNYIAAGPTDDRMNAVLVGAAFGF